MTKAEKKKALEFYRGAVNDSLNHFNITDKHERFFAGWENGIFAVLSNLGISDDELNAIQDEEIAKREA